MLFTLTDCDSSSIPNSTFLTLSFPLSTLNLTHVSHEGHRTITSIEFVPLPVSPNKTMRRIWKQTHIYTYIRVYVYHMYTYMYKIC